MTPNEFAFLALGLLLGIATGAAIVVVLRSKPPTHDIRVTVTRDAIPRRASTLATDVLHGTADGPAPGGPGDRRLVDRDGAGHRTGVHPDGLPVVASPILPWSPDPQPGREMPAEPALARAGRPIALAIQPEPDPMLARLGLGPSPSTTASAGSPASAAAAPGMPGPANLPVAPTLLHDLLAGDHAAMRGAIEAVAGPDEASQRAWDTLLTRFVEAVRQRAIDVGLVDLPMGNPFWDAFTIDQCRQIVLTLQATGRRYDGRSDWADGQVPAYRDLSRALADCGIDPRRVRAWPNSLEIAELFRGARVASAEAVARAAPSLEADDLRAFLDQRDRGLDELWPLWDAVRGALLGIEAASA
ncbi:MAG TPA: hypothetical protein VGI98_07540 [Candidatus Limnocylindrales bacterium]